MYVYLYLHVTRKSLQLLMKIPLTSEDTHVCINHKCFVTVHCYSACISLSVFPALLVGNFQQLSAGLFHIECIRVIITWQVLRKTAAQGRKKCTATSYFLQFWLYMINTAVWSKLIMRDCRVSNILKLSPADKYTRKYASTRLQHKPKIGRGS